MITAEKIQIIAAEEAHNVCEAGSPNAKQHNARVVEQAIRRAIEAYSSENCMNVLIDDERHEYLLNCEKQLADNKIVNENQLKLAWETGFNLCRSYGDNWAHFDGEQKEKRWRMTLPGLIRNSKCKCP